MMVGKTSILLVQQAYHLNAIFFSSLSSSSQTNVKWDFQKCPSDLEAQVSLKVLRVLCPNLNHLGAFGSQPMSL